MAFAPDVFNGITPGNPLARSDFFLVPDEAMPGSGGPFLNAPGLFTDAEGRMRPCNYYPGILAAIFLHQIEKGTRIWRFQADAAMRGRRAQTGHGIGAVNGIAAKEEYRIRHRRIIIYARIMHALHGAGAKTANRCAIAAPTG